MRKAVKGLTLIEILVVLAITAVLASIAAPGFKQMLLRQAVDTAANRLVSDIRYARSEALKRSRRVTVCASSSGTACTGSGPAWKDGWIVFVPSNTNGEFTTGDTILRVQPALQSVASIAPATGSTLQKFVFEATGWAKAATQTFQIKPSGSTDAQLIRLVCVSNQGRAALRPRGETACS